jgi:diaminobutyrate-2-oxoglutarate transaminase
MNICDELESNVRIYSRTFPAIFKTASGALLKDNNGVEYIDFFSGAGALNYGHNPPRLKRKLIEYLEQDGVTHSLDMTTTAKCEFLEAFQKLILRPRGLDYKVQFTAPTGADAVEAALKLARKITGRRTIVCFADAYHGVTLGALAITSDMRKRGAAGVPLNHSVTFSFECDAHGKQDALHQLEAYLDHCPKGILPAALIVETIQAEGGVKVASTGWMKRLREVTRQHGVLLIIDDIQVGCGRTGDFFSFESIGIVPDMVCLSKSISGMGLPMALLLIRPELDLWNPGEHVGTFRGHNLAFVTAREALNFWIDNAFSDAIGRKAALLRQTTQQLVSRYPETISGVRGRGLIEGIVFHRSEDANEVARDAFSRGVLVETAGRNCNVLKILPPLTISEVELMAGLEKIDQSVEVLPRKMLAFS